MRARRQAPPPMVFPNLRSPTVPPVSGIAVMALVFQPANALPGLAYRLAGKVFFPSYATVRSAIMPDVAPLPPKRIV